MRRNSAALVRLTRLVPKWTHQVQPIRATLWGSRMLWCGALNSRALWIPYSAFTCLFGSRVSDVYIA